jgi:carbon starvation protein CstA
MTVFLVGCVLLVLGYTVYGRVAERAVRPDPNRVTPAIALADGLDFVAMPTWRVSLIQLLNIAGLGLLLGAVALTAFLVIRPRLEPEEDEPVVAAGSV